MATKATTQEPITGTDGEVLVERWRKPQSAGFGSFGSVGTILVFVDILVMIAWMVFGHFVIGIVQGAAGFLFLSWSAVRNPAGESRLEKLNLRVMTWYARVSGFTDYHSGPLTRHGGCPIPGLGARSELTTWVTEPDKEPFALVRVPQTSHYAVTIDCHPDGGGLMDGSDQVNIVHSWGDHLKYLSLSPSFRQLMITVITEPASTTALARYIQSRLTDDAPPVAVSLAKDVGALYPKRAAQARSYATITYSGSDHSGRRDARRMGADLAEKLPELLDKLSGTGAGECWPVDGRSLTEMMRAEYQPSMRQTITDMHELGDLLGAGADVLRWNNTGPVNAVELPDMYLFADAVARTWTLADITGVIGYQTLERLLKPDSRVDYKRVSLVYTVRSPGAGSQQAEKDVNATEFREGSAKTPGARVRKDTRSAKATAEHEANDEAVVDVAAIVTCVQLIPDLPGDCPIEDRPKERAKLITSRVKAMNACMDDLGPAAKMLLREENGTQAVAFQLGLPGLGLVARDHLLIPEAFREGL